MHDEPAARPDTDPPGPDPTAAARRLSAPELPKRFYARAEAVERDGVFRLELDGRSARTPAKHLLAVPTRVLADAIAGEWNAQGERIDPSTMPATRLANTALDGVAHRMDEVRADVLAYAGTDMLFYRAGEPEGLADRQRAVWDPVLAWAKSRYGARFVLAEGVMHVGQPAGSLASIGEALERYADPFALTGLHIATTLAGSALLALALAEGALSVEDAWAAAHVDEDWNMRLWGADEGALARRARRYEDFRAAALALRG